MNSTQRADMYLGTMGNGADKEDDDGGQDRDSPFLMWVSILGHNRKRDHMPRYPPPPRECRITFIWSQRIPPHSQRLWPEEATPSDMLMTLECATLVRADSRSPDLLLKFSIVGRRSNTHSRFRAKSVRIIIGGAPLFRSRRPTNESTRSVSL